MLKLQQDESLPAPNSEKQMLIRCRDLFKRWEIQAQRLHVSLTPKLDDPRPLLHENLNIYKAVG